MAITIDETKVGHIFRQAPGHFAEDTSNNRQAMINVANRPSNLIGSDRFGNEWYAETQPGGGQIWVQLRGRAIVNGGINPTPRAFKLALPSPPATDAVQ
jgi:hypothetical protein